MAVRRNPYPTATASTDTAYQPPTGFNPYEQGGVTGKTQVVDQAPVPPATPPVAPPPQPTFDATQQVGHNGSINGMNREQYRDDWLSSGGKNNADLDAWLSKHGGVRQGKNGTVMTPFGEVIDMGQGFSAGDGRAQWGGVGGPAKPTSTASMMMSGMGGGAGSGGGVPAGGGGGSASGSASSSPAMSMDEIMKFLGPLMTNGGGFNEGAFGRRLDSVRGALDRQKKSTLENQRAIMADRGLLGSGAETTNLGRIDQDISDQFSNQVNSIYADESDRADSRMISALQMATGMTEEQARNAVQYAGISSSERLGHERNANDFSLGQGNLELGRSRDAHDFSLGQGNLALGNLNAMNGYNLGAGRLSLDQENSAYDHQNTSVDELIKLIQAQMQGADISSNGHY